MRTRLHPPCPPAAQCRVARTARPSRTRLQASALVDVDAEPSTLASILVLEGVGLPPDAAAELVAAAGGPLHPDQIEQACRVLVDLAGVPVCSLRDVLLKAPEVLAVPPSALEQQYEVLLEAWPDERQLRSAVRSHPAILTQAFTTNLKRCMATLEELGFTKAQTAAAILGAPAVAQLRRYELVNVLTQTGVSLAGADPCVFEFLSKRPQCLTPEGSARLAAVLRQLKAWGLTPQQAQTTAARCPLILRAAPQRLQQIAAALKEFGLSPEERVQVVSGWPPLLAKGPARVKQTLALLAWAGVKPAQLAAYPRAFTHSPLYVLGPRLAYLKAHEPEGLGSKLVTLLSRGDEEFVARWLPDAELEDFLEFARSWELQYARRPPPWPPGSDAEAKEKAANAEVPRRDPPSKQPGGSPTQVGATAGRGSSQNANSPGAAASNAGNSSFAASPGSTSDPGNSPAKPPPAPPRGNAPGVRDQRRWQGRPARGWPGQGRPGSRQPPGGRQPGSRPPGSRPPGQAGAQRRPAGVQAPAKPPPAKPAEPPPKSP